MSALCGVNNIFVGDSINFSHPNKYLKCKTKKGPRKTIYRAVVIGYSKFTVTRAFDNEIEIYPAKR